MTLNIEVNDDKELSGTANGIYFVVYKDMLGALTPSDTLALVEAAAELEALRQQLAEVTKAATAFMNEVPESEIELARKVFGNTNTRIMIEKRRELEAALKLVTPVE